MDPARGFEPSIEVFEGILRFKEISYIHAEGYPAGEMKHGPNALIDETLPVVVIATQDACTFSLKFSTNQSHERPHDGWIDGPSEMPSVLLPDGTALPEMELRG